MANIHGQLRARRRQQHSRRVDGSSRESTRICRTSTAICSLSRTGRRLGRSISVAVMMLKLCQWSSRGSAAGGSIDRRTNYAGSFDPDLETGAGRNISPNRFAPSALQLDGSACTECHRHAHYICGTQQIKGGR